MLIQVKRPGAAVELLAGFSAANPDDAEAAVLLAWALRDDHRPAESLVVAERAIAADPEHAPAHSMRGLALLDLGRYHQAAIAMRQAIGIEPGSAVNWSNLATVLLRDSREAAALEAAQKAVRLDPTSTYSHVMQAMALDQLHRYDEAGAALREALRLDPDLALAHALNVSRQARRRDVVEMARDMDRLVRADPRHLLVRRGVTAVVELVLLILGRGTQTMLVLTWVLVSVPWRLSRQELTIGRAGAVLVIVGLLARRLWLLRDGWAVIWRYARRRVPTDRVLAFMAVLVILRYTAAIALCCVPVLDGIAVGGWIVLVLTTATLVLPGIHKAWVERLNGPERRRG